MKVTFYKISCELEHFCFTNISLLPKIDEELLTFQLHPNYFAGQDLSSKQILKNQSTIDLVAKSLLDTPNGTYTDAATEWKNGTRCDVLYVPRLAIQKFLPPILIEIQRTVNEPFMRRLIQYSLNVTSTYDSLPMVLIFCVDKVTPQALQDQFKSSADKPYLSSFPCVVWATKCYLVSKQMPFDVDTPLDPLYAISLFLSQQQPSLFRHSHPEDATIQLLYKITMDASIEDNNYKSNFIDTINVICSTNENILERAKNAIIVVPLPK